jgi:hypothetical protein
VSHVAHGVATWFESRENETDLVETGCELTGDGWNWLRIVSSGRGYEDGKWMELAQDRVHWGDFVLAVLNLGVLLPQC